MNLQSILRNNKVIYFILILFALLLMFNSTYNPFNFTRMHVDSSVYVTIAQGITRGKLPYTDFPDNKGPLLFLINAAGWKVGGFNGIWLIDLLFTCFSVIFCYKIALFFGDRHKALLGTIFSLFILNAFLDVNAGTEGYSMPFLMISLYIFTKYYFSPKQEVNFFELVLLGTCFTLAALIRLNVFPLWAGFCVVILIESVIKRRFLQLVKYIWGFSLGIIIAGFPVFLYLGINGILNDFFEHVIFGGIARGFGEGGLKETAQNFFIVLNRNFSIIPLAVGLYWMIKKFGHNTFGYFSGYLFSYLMMLLFISFSSTLNHSNAVLVPFFIPAITYLIGIIDSAFSERKTKNLLTIIFFCFVFSDQIVNYLYDVTKIFRRNSNASGIELINAGKMIDENTNPGDKIISLGGNAYIYPFTIREMASKYFYQSSSFDFIDGAKEEFLTDILINKPAIIALFTADDGDGSFFIMPDWQDPILEMIKNEYRLLSDENGFNLYIRQ